jgi:hypothetical protein
MTEKKTLLSHAELVSASLNDFEKLSQKIHFSALGGRTFHSRPCLRQAGTERLLYIFFPHPPLSPTGTGIG